MLATEPEMVLPDLGVAAQAAWSAEVPEPEPISRRAKRFRARRTRTSDLPRAEKLRRLRFAEYEELRVHRFAGLRFPPRFDLQTLVRRFQEIDRDPAHGDLKRRIDNETLKILESWQNATEYQTSSGLLDEGLTLLRSEVQTIRRRFRLIQEQRTRQLHWAMICLVTGDLPAGIAETLTRGHFWESVQIQAIEQIVLPKTLDAAGQAPSRRALDGVAREMRKAVLDLGRAGDNVLNARERVLLTIDMWNSPTVDRIYRTKPWRREPLRTVELDSLAARARDSADALRNRLFEQSGRDTIRSLIRLDDVTLPYAKALFDAVVEEVPA